MWPYLLKGLRIERPDHLWCADITYIQVQRGFLYVVAIMDWASRHVLAWRLSNTLDAGCCTDALDEALARYGAPEIFNTDQGSQFTGFAFTGRLQAAGIRISMDGRGRCMDNIFIERLWRSLKYDAVYLHEIADGFTARRVIGEWIGFYNTQRPHSALGGRTPAEACRGGPPVGMWTSRFAPCPHPHRRNSSNRKIDSRGFWRPELQPEYTLAKPPSCPKRRGHLNDHTCRMDWRREPHRRLANVDTIDLRNLATDCGPEPARLMGGHARRLQSPPSRRRCLCGLAPGTGSALRW